MDTLGQNQLAIVEGPPIGRRFQKVPENIHTHPNQVICDVIAEAWGKKF